MPSIKLSMREPYWSLPAAVKRSRFVQGEPVGEVKDTILPLRGSNPGLLSLVPFFTYAPSVPFNLLIQN